MAVDTVQAVLARAAAALSVVFAVAEALTEVIVDMGLGEAFKRYIENGRGPVR